MLVVAASRFHTTSNTGIDSIEGAHAGLERLVGGGAALPSPLRCWPRVCRVPASRPMPARSSFLALNGWLRIAVPRSDFRWGRDCIPCCSAARQPRRRRNSPIWMDNPIAARRSGRNADPRVHQPGRQWPRRRDPPAVGGVRPRPSSPDGEHASDRPRGPTENGASHPSTKTFSPARVDNGEPEFHGRYATALVDASAVD